MQRESGSGKSIMGDSVELKLIESESLLHFDDVESPNAPPAISPKSTWAGMPSFSSSTIPELVSYFGFRGVVIILLLKVLTVVIFALFFFGPSNTNSSAGDYSTVGLVVGRPEGLREIIRESSRNAAVLGAGPQKALFTLQTRRELVYDNYIEVGIYNIYLILMLFSEHVHLLTIHLIYILNK